MREFSSIYIFYNTNESSNLLIYHCLIEYSTLQNQYQVQQPLKYLKTNFEDGVALPSCYLSHREISQLEISLDETIELGEWINAQVSCKVK